MNNINIEEMDTLSKGIWVIIVLSNHNKLICNDFAESRICDFLCKVANKYSSNFENIEIIKSIVLSFENLTMESSNCNQLYENDGCTLLHRLLIEYGSLDLQLCEHCIACISNLCLSKDMNIKTKFGDLQSHFLIASYLSEYDHLLSLLEVCLTSLKEISVGHYQNINHFASSKIANQLVTILKKYQENPLVVSLTLDVISSIISSSDILDQLEAAGCFEVITDALHFNGFDHQIIAEKSMSILSALSHHHDPTAHLREIAISNVDFEMQIAEELRVILKIVLIHYRHSETIAQCGLQLARNIANDQLHRWVSIAESGGGDVSIKVLKRYWKLSLPLVELSLDYLSHLGMISGRYVSTAFGEGGVLEILSNLLIEYSAKDDRLAFSFVSTLEVLYRSIPANIANQGDPSTCQILTELLVIYGLTNLEVTVKLFEALVHVSMFGPNRASLGIIQIIFQKFN